MKKLFVLFFIILFVTSFTPLAAKEPAGAEITVSRGELKNEISSKISKELKNSITLVYGTQRVDEIYDNVLTLARKALNERPDKLKSQDELRKADWYKDEIIYMFYVDQFGVVSNGANNTFRDIKSMLDYLQDLGVTTLYMLPFAESPIEDSGFDVKNPRDVRKNLGGITQFREFATLAKEKGFKIKADLVLNHFSDEHEWFKLLERGDIKALDYFVYTDKMPEYTKYQDEKLGTVIEYKEDNGLISKRRLIFPENTENNYRKITLSGKDYYLYHTFYPFQLDINWENPEVLYYMLETVSYWANCGVDIFRMDAVPYLSKEKGTNAEKAARERAKDKTLVSYFDSRDINRGNIQ